jgi:hypothetical protein
MPRIIVQANQSHDEAGCVTLSELVLATHPQDDHYATQLIERLTWPAINAEQLASPKDGQQADEHRRLRPTRPLSETVSSRPRTRPIAGERREWR